MARGENKTVEPARSRSGRDLLYGRQRVVKARPAPAPATPAPEPDEGFVLERSGELPDGPMRSQHFPHANIVYVSTELSAAPTMKRYRGYLALIEREDGQGWEWLGFTTYGPSNAGDRSKFVEYRGPSMQQALSRVNDKLAKKQAKGYASPSGTAIIREHDVLAELRERWAQR